MKHYVSVSKYPGKQGQYFYTSFFKLHNLDADYTPLAVTEESLPEILHTARTNGTCGISVSMPFKNAVIDYLDVADSSVTEYHTCNTIVINEGKFVGYNTDLAGVRYVTSLIHPSEHVSILGNGSMGKLFAQYLYNAGYRQLSVYSRSSGNWDDRHTPADVVINCTAVGTVNNDSPLCCLPNRTSLVIDLSISPGQLQIQCADKCVQYVSGKEFYQKQFLEQYKIYTGIEPQLSDYENIADKR
jgi:shikimate 5-dehydrogenase